jgi:Pyridoxamine 5'-phosphate oxidase
LWNRSIDPNLGVMAQDAPDSLTGIPQGDPRLLGTSAAQRLLRAPMPVRLAYIALDRTPRVVPINAVWTDDELVMGSFAGNHKLRALRAQPDVAICIDTIDGAVEALLLRGRVSLTEVDGLVPEYAAAHRKVIGGDASEAYLAAIDQPGLVMVRIGLRPSWVGVLDFHDRLPDRTPKRVRAALTGTS